MNFKKIITLSILSLFAQANVLLASDTKREKVPAEATLSIPIASLQHRHIVDLTVELSADGTITPDHRITIMEHTAPDLSVAGHREMLARKLKDMEIAHCATKTLVLLIQGHDLVPSNKQFFRAIRDHLNSRTDLN